MAEETKRDMGSFGSWSGLPETLLGCNLSKGFCSETLWTQTPNANQFERL